MKRIEDWVERDGSILGVLHGREVRTSTIVEVVLGEEWSVAVAKIRTRSGSWYELGLHMDVDKVRVWENLGHSVETPWLYSWRMAKYLSNCV